MKKLYFFAVVMTLSSQTLANTDDIKQHITTGYEYTDYTEDRGHKDVRFIEYGRKKGKTAIVTKVASINRDFNQGESAIGIQGGLDVSYDWNKFLSTKSGATFSDHNPTLARSEYRHDFYLKPIKNFVVNLGGKHATYDNDIEVDALSYGLSWYSKRLILSYKYTGFDASDKPKTHGNTVSVKVKDQTGLGSTQLWVGSGKGAYGYEWDNIDTMYTNDIDSIAVRREQPITNNLLVGVTLGKTRYNIPSQDYDAVKGQLDFIYKW